jgi:two-component system sensor histidine kinase FlrB
MALISEQSLPAVVTDRSTERKLVELLARHQRLAALGEMAAALAHQLRTPLAAALLYASNASRPGLAAEQREKLLGNTVSCLHDLEQLIGDMLQFARGARFNISEFSLDELLDSVETSLRPAIAPSQEVAIVRAALPVRLRGNREALAGALLNLATNALQSAGARARVEIRAEATARQVEIRVTDNGPGVPAAIRQRIFDPFFTSRATGTGLGLAVARSVARDHRGDIELQQGAAPGAIFVMRLPLDGIAGQNPREAAA